MTQTATGVPAPTAEAPGFLIRVLGVLFSPRATFTAIAAQPRWLGVLVFVVLVMSCSTFLFLSTEVGRQALLDQQVRTMEAFGRNIPDEQYQQMERFLPFAAYASAASQLVFIPILALVVSGLLFAVFSGLMGGDATFKQVFAVVSHAGVVTALQALFSQPLAYARGTLSSSTSLGVFVPFLEETSFVARLLGSIDLFIVWWVITLAIGLGVVYRRRTGPIATTLLLVYVVIAVVIAVVRSALSGA